MKRSSVVLSGCLLSAMLAEGCGGSPPAGQPPGAGPAESVSGAPAPPAGERTVTVPTADANRPFVRLNFDALQWRATEGNTLGVQTAVLEGDPSKPGFRSEERRVWKE